MPQKINRAGQMQNYVPAGNGDASGEYGDNATGSNKHFKAFKKPEKQREKKKIKFKYNSFYNEFMPMTDTEYANYLRRKESAEKNGYYGYSKDVFEDRDITMLDEDDTNKIKKEVEEQISKEIDNANIDNIKNYTYLYGNIINNAIMNSLNDFDIEKQDKEYFSTTHKWDLLTEENKKQLEEKAKTKAVELANKYIDDNFTKIKGEHTIEQDLANVNPNYNDSSGYYKINCQRCSFAYELRRRGYDVEANPNKNDFGSANLWQSQMQIKDQKIFKNSLGAQGVAKRIINEVKNAGNGSRWAVDVQWYRRTSGHLFIAENVNGEVKFYDAQTGDNNCIRYFNNIAVTKETIIYRMDNADFSYGVKETGFSPNRKGE